MTTIDGQTRRRAAHRPGFDHDQFVEVCGRRGIEPERAEAVWRDMVGTLQAPAARRGLSRPALGAAVIGAILLSAAGIWWATLVTSAVGAPGLLALAVAWIACSLGTAEIVRRRAIPYLDALVALIAVAYAGVAVGTVVYLLAGSSFGSHWWGRAPVELVLLAAGSFAWWRYRRPLVGMAVPTFAGAAVVVDTVVSSFGGWDRDITDWPLWMAPVALGVAALIAGFATGLDRRGLRAEAMWPSLLADGMSISAIVGIAAAAHAAQRGAGAAIALAGLTILVRGGLGGRLAQLGIGGLTFWIGIITLGSVWGELAVAGLTTLAGLSLIAGAIVLSRRKDLLRQGLSWRRRSRGPKPPHGLSRTGYPTARG